jgi:hypothetical protein
MELAKIFCMTKNEYDLIEDFIIYYAYIFGYNNIIIIDNMSTHQVVLEVYNKYKNLGVTIYQEEEYDQSTNYTKYMNMYKLTCKFLIGVDTDEFIFSTEHLRKGLDPCDRIYIQNIFENISENTTLCKIDSYPFSIPDPTSSNYIDQQITYPAQFITTFNISMTDKQYYKAFYRSDAFVKTNIGNHGGIINYGVMNYISLGYVHYQNTGSRRKFERNQQTISAFKYFNVASNYIEQYNHIIAMNITNNLYGFHAIIQYKDILLRHILVDYFILYLKRLPVKEELEIIIERFKNNIIDEIQTYFINLDETITKPLLLPVKVNLEDKEAIIYQDIPIYLNDNIQIFDFVAKKLNMIHKNLL